MLSLETSLVTEEMKEIYYILEKQRHGENKEASEQLKNSLVELSEKRRIAVQSLWDRQAAEVTDAGLEPALVIPKNIPETDEGILSNLKLLVSVCQESVRSAKNNVLGSLEDKGKVLTASIPSQGNLQATVPVLVISEEGPTLLEYERLETEEQLEASKLVTQDIQKQLCLYRTLDFYSELQRRSPGEIDGSRGQDRERDKDMAYGVAKSLTHQQVERLSLLLQAQSEERTRWRKPSEELTPQEENQHDAVSGRTVNVSHREMLAKLDMKYKAEIRKELLFQRKERERLIEIQLRSREERAMAEFLAGGGRSEVPRMVQCLQVNRHLRQWVSLKQELHQIREQLVTTATAPGNTPVWPLVSEADEEMRLVCEHAESRPLALMELQEVTAELELRETGLLELADTLKRFTSHKCVVEAEDLAKELKALRHERLKRLSLELEMVKSEKTTQQEYKRHRLEKQVKELEAELEEERKADGEILEQKRFDKQREQQLLVTEERLKLQDQLERGELTNPLRENLVEDQSESLGPQQTSLQQEIVSVEREQEARREQKRAQALRHILERRAVEEQEDDARYSRQIEHVLTEVTEDFQQAVTLAALRISLLQVEFALPGLQEADLDQKSSPILPHLQEADEELEAKSEPTELVQSEDHQKEWSTQIPHRHQETDRPFIDPLDAQWTCEGELIPVNPESLSLTEFVVYRFGTFIVQLMKRSIKAPEVSLLLACSLPTNNYAHNAFRNSFFYQHSERRLFIRRGRLTSLGDFALLLVHCLAHITAGQLSNDTNPLFLRLFHQGVKALFNDMFSTRLHLTPASQALKPSSGSRDNPYRGKLCSDEYFDTVSELLNLNVKETTGVEFSAKKLHMCEDTGTSQGEAKRDAEGSTQPLCGRIKVRESNGDGLESRAALERERIEEKMDGLTAELSVALQSVLTIQENTMTKKKILVERVRELEAELDSWQKVAP